MKITALIQEQFDRMCATGKLFRSSLTGQQVWDIYLEGFGNDPIFRDTNSSVHNCQLCNNFLRRYGNIVAVNLNFTVMTIFDIECDNEYKASFNRLSEALKNAPIQEVFFETYDELKSLPYEQCTKNQITFKLGIDKNVKRYTKEDANKYGVVKENEIRTFEHLHLYLPNQFVDMGSRSIEAIMADYRDAKNVFERGLAEISIDTLNLVRDLILQGSLLDGQTHLYKIDSIIPKKLLYDELSKSEKDNWLWINSYKFKFAKFKNELIGVLCSELAEGKELNAACQAWNKRVDPVNYMKTTAPITKRQIQEAKEFVEENGYVESFNRRFANIDDIKVSEILHSNVGTGEIKSVSIFDEVKSTSTRHKKSEFEGVETVSIDKFMKDILPGCTSVEAFLQNHQDGNMVSLTTANVKESKPIFKWNNNYSWTFNGNLAGKSQIKDAVQSRGGKTEGVVNIRLAFPNTESDYDLHVREPNGGNEIYYGNRRQIQVSSGMLDLDAEGADGHFTSDKRVENIIYTDKKKMPKGKYLVFVHNYTHHDSNFGFTIEIEIAGEITTFSYNEYIPQKASVIVCYLNVGDEIEIQPMLPVSQSNSISKEIYGLTTNQFHKVNLVCLSPNHWDTNNVGNKHYFFMLDKCKCPTPIRSFHSENLIPELADHRKVLEILGTTTMIEPMDKQLSGLGFNATVSDELIVKLQGTHKRVIKIKF